MSRVVSSFAVFPLRMTIPCALISSILAASIAAENHGTWGETIISLSMEYSDGWDGIWNWLHVEIVLERNRGWLMMYWCVLYLRLEHSG